MTKCDDCGKEFGSVDSCTHPFVRLEGKVFRRGGSFEVGKGFSADFESGIIAGRCDDCGTLNSKIHHYGCSEEKCPSCGDGLVTCSCDNAQTLKTA
jgi:hypothetical protein